MARLSAMHKIPLGGTTGTVYHPRATIELALTCVINNCNTTGSFHVNSTNFGMFFHGPPWIVLKFGTVVEHGKKNTH